MATTGVNNHQNKENEGRRDYGRKSYDNDGQRERKPFKSREDKYKGEKAKDDRARSNRFKDDKPRGERRTDDRAKGEFKRGGNYRNDNGGSYRDNFSKGFDKDKDDLNVNNRRFKPVQKENKPKEAQSEKQDIKNRLEKEKKAIKKKQSEGRRDVRTAKHQVKPKRTGNIDWTREYENDSYDDDDLDMYL